jgi:hypothetical protein
MIEGASDFSAGFRLGVLPSEATSTGVAGAVAWMSALSGADVGVVGEAAGAVAGVTAAAGACAPIPACFLIAVSSLCNCAITFSKFSTRFAMSSEPGIATGDGSDDPFGPFGTARAMSTKRLCDGANSTVVKGELPNPALLAVN